jgi:hypothetical protein
MPTPSIASRRKPQPTHIRLGEMLVEHGVMTPEQCDEVLQVQKLRGGAFGAIAEDLFGIEPAAVERAWVEQYAGLTRSVDPRRCAISPAALTAISRRQAWQFRMLPMQILANGCVVCCTSKQHLVRALRFAGWRIGHDCEFVLADARHLGEALCEYYPMAGMTAESVEQNVGHDLHL